MATLSHIEYKTRALIRYDRERSGLKTAFAGSTKESYFDFSEKECNFD